MELVRGNNLDLHDRLKDDRLGPLKRFAECTQSSSLERLIGRVDRVPGTIVHYSPDSDDREANLAALLDGQLEALVAGRNIFGRDGSTLDLVDKLVVLVLLSLDRIRKRLKVTGNSCILTRTTGLLLVGVVEVGTGGDCLAVGHLGLTDFNLCLVLALHTLDIDFEVQFTHALDDGLVGLGIDVAAECGIFLGKAVESLAHIVGSLLVHRLDGQRNNRVGNKHGGEGVVELGIAEGVSAGALDSEEGCDFAATDFSQVFHGGCMHANQAAYTELFLGPGVVELIALLHLALIHTNIGKLAVLTVLKLEGKNDGRQVIVSLENDLFLVLVQVKSLVHDIGRIGQVADNSIEQRLDALVLVCRAHEHRAEFETDGSFADGLLQQFNGYVVLKHGFHKLIGAHGNTVKQLFALGDGFCHEMGGNLSFTDLVCIRTGIEVQCLHGHQVDNAFQMILKPDGNLHQNRIQAELLDQLLFDTVRIGPGSVAFIDKGNTGNMVALHLPVNGNRLALYAADGAKYQHCAVKYAQ
ncbi:hypothetical protein DSECCO2_450710 [anaerobic digester metagenome]